MDDADWARIRRLAEDWTTIWQSEMAARGSDPETGETVRAVFEAWLRAADFAGRPRLRPHDARADAAAGAAAADAASRARDDEIQHLRRRLDRLERRLEPAADVRVDARLAGGAGPDEPPA